MPSHLENELQSAEEGPARVRGCRHITGFFITGLLAGCVTSPRAIDVLDYPVGGEPQRFNQEFDTCYYRKAPDGSIDLVAQRWPENGAQGRSPASQTLELHIFYEPIASRSPSHPSMTNALVTYIVMSEGATCSFDGGGFVSWSPSRWDDQMIFYIERSVLKPLRVLGDATPIFEQPRVTGRLSARRDDRKVVTILNDLRRTFGPLPDEKPPMTDPRLR